MDYSKVIANEVAEVLSHVQLNEIDDFVETLSKYKQQGRAIFLSGAGRSLLMIRTFAMRLMHLGYEVHVVGDTTTPAIKKEDLLIIGSGSGETKVLKILANTALEIGSEIILITRNNESYLADKSNTVLYIPLIPSIQPSGSIFEQSMFLVLDSIVLKLMENEDEMKNMNIDDYINIRHANLE